MAIKIFKYFFLNAFPKLNKDDQIPMRYVTFILAGLCILTIVVLVWHHFGMNKVFTITSNSPYKFVIVDDRGQIGGKSVATFEKINNKIIVDCSIAEGYEWPYCDMEVFFTTPAAGIDLSSYQVMKLWIHYDETQPHLNLRIYVRNFNAVYSKADDPASLKVQQIEYDPNRYTQPFEVKLSQFLVASWWSAQNNIPIEYANPEFSNVSSIEIATGGVVFPGQYRISIERIEFCGKYISSEKLQLIIIYAWLFFSIGYLIVNAVIGRQALMKSKRSLELLNKNQSQLIEEGVNNERARVSMDMHDSLGSQLLGILQIAEGSKPEMTSITRELRIALDYLKITVDAMQTPDGDINALLGTLRYRLSPRLAAANIELSWVVDTLPIVSHFSTAQLRELQMIFLEAFSNIISHSKATSIQLTAISDVGSNNIQITLKDNGQGFDNSFSEQGGCGITNMKKRSLKIGAEFTLSSSQEGTEIKVTIPFSKVGNN